MKNILVLLLFVSPLVSIGQNLINDNFPTKDGLIYYSEVVITDSLTSNDLYINAKKWIAENIKSSQTAIQVDDKDAKLIILKSYVSKGHNTYVSNPKNWFTLKIELKDGKYKYSLYDIRYEFDVNYMGQFNHTEKAIEEWMKPSDSDISEKKRQKINEALTLYCIELNSEFMNVIKSLEKGMKIKENSEW